MLIRGSDEMANLVFPKIKNSMQVGTSVFVGTNFENSITRAALLSARPKLEYIFIRTQDDRASKSDTEVRQELSNALSGRKNAIVISDIGDTRTYTFEKLANDVKTISPQTAFALVTSRQECVGEHVFMEKFVQERGVDPSVLSKIDYTLQYSGNDMVFPALLRMHEDKLNFPFDRERIILVVEDKPSYYTNFVLSLERINEGRTRVLLARDFESASQLVESTKGRLAGAILDMRFPMSGDLVDSACQDVARLIRESDAKVPIVFQSADKALVEKAKQDPRVFALHKDEGIFNQLRGFINDYFGFGAFVFRMPNGAEIARVDSLAGLVQFVKSATPGSVMEASVLYHASHNNFSNWLWLHGYKDAADGLKPADPKTLDDAKKNILGACEPYL